MISEFKNNYFFLSNFYTSNVEIGGIVYKNAEAAFQAHKTLDIEQRKKFANISSPSSAKYMGRRIDLREDWNNIRDRIMYDVVYAKFNQNEYLKEKLINTGYQYLEEGNTWGDTYWGVYKGTGQNKLGLILQLIRDELRNNDYHNYCIMSDDLNELLSKYKNKPEYQYG